MATDRAEYRGRLITDGTFIISSKYGTDGMSDAYSLQAMETAVIVSVGADIVVTLVEGQNVWVGVELVVRDAAPGLPSADWELSEEAEVSFRDDAVLETVETGRGFDGNLGDFTVPPGHYRLRALAKGREQSRFVEWGGADQPTDPALLPEQIRIDFWPI